MKKKTERKRADFPSAANAPEGNQIAPAASPDGAGPFMPWIFAGFLIAYVPFLLVPVFFNTDHMMSDICPILQVKDAGIGMDLREILEFSHSWFREHKTPYIKTNTYPPLETLFFVPFLYLHFDTAYVLMTLITFVCYLAITLVLPILFLRQRHLSSLVILFVTTGLFSYGLLFEMERGQFNVLAMTFCLLGVYLFHFHPRRRIPAYVLFCLSVQLKVYPAIFILMLVDNWREWKPIVKRFAMLGAANFLSLFILGLGPFREFVVGTLGKMSNPFLWVGNHSITGYSRVMEITYHVPSEAFLFGLLVFVLLMLFAVLAISFLRRIEGFNPYLLVACTVCALLIPPLSHDYTLVVLQVEFDGNPTCHEILE